ncbi:ATP-binding cassette domain-containing protein [candidate division KSB1 bacterium]|nr:ATP-binding cassette domain-containing protein [candidate division KSB1 bacterium]
MIDVKQVTRYFGQVAAVTDISFQVEKGEIIGFLGPNAAGKTTTMRVLTTYLPATSGTATIAGFDVHEQSMEVRKRIGYLPENPPLYQEMRVRDYLNFVAKIKGIESKNMSTAVGEAMEKTAITDVKTRVIKHLSKGYKQRVGLAQAIVHNPEVLVLDEPTVGLDPKQIIEVRELIKGLAGDHTIILSTHILPEVSMTCERVVIIDKGKVVAEDTPENLTKNLSGSQQLTLSIGGPVKEIKENLLKIKGVESVTAKENVNNDSSTLIIESKGKDEIRPIIAKAIVEKGWSLYEMKSRDMSLEDVFLHLTTKEEGPVQ